MGTKGIPRIASWIAACGAGFALACLVMPSRSGADEKPSMLDTRVVRWDEAAKHKGDWGEIRFHFRGETFGTKDVLAGIAVVQPGKAVHRAHRHAEEEYLIITEGSGTWNVNEKEFPAKKGDILYVAPWDYHGFVNTGDKPLTFAVVRFSSKGVKIPPRPDSRPNEL